METEKNKRTSMMKYLRELSIVVLGIAITISISSWLSNRNDKKDLRLYLNAIKLELEENLQIEKKHKEYHDLAKEFADYIASDATKNSHKVKEFSLNMGKVDFMYIRTSAFEMFKNSGMMRLLQDKILLEHIWNTYSSLESTRDANNIYMQQKWDELFNHMLASNNSSTNFTLTGNDRLITFLAIDVGFYKNFEEGIKLIESTLELLN